MSMLTVPVLLGYDQEKQIGELTIDDDKIPAGANWVLALGYRVLEAERRPGTNGINVIDAEVVNVSLVSDEAYHAYLNSPVYAEDYPDEVEIREQAAKYRALTTPEIVDFQKAVEREALFQREMWAEKGDAGKTDADWFWLLGYLGGKAIQPNVDPEKQLHRIIATAAACLNWHAARVGAYTNMRPGIAEPVKVRDET